MSNCTSCNKELALNAKFCKFCGKSQAVKLPSNSDVAVVINEKLTLACKKCNNELIPSAKFCKVCGTKVSAEPITDLPITKTPKTTTVNPTININKTESQLVGNEVSGPSDSSIEIANKKTGITGLQITITLFVIILLVVFISVTHTPTEPSAVQETAVAPSVAPPIEIDAYAEEARNKLAEEEAKKKSAEDEARRIAEEEKLLLLQQQKEKKALLDLAEDVSKHELSKPAENTSGDNQWDWRVQMFTTKVLCKSYNGYTANIEISKEGVLKFTKNGANEITVLQGQVDFSTIKNETTTDKYYTVNGTLGGSSTLKLYTNNQAIFRIEISQTGNAYKADTLICQ